MLSRYVWPNCFCTGFEVIAASAPRLNATCVCFGFRNPAAFASSFPEVSHVVTVAARIAARITARTQILVDQVSFTVQVPTTVLSCDLFLKGAARFFSLI